MSRTLTALFDTRTDAEAGLQRLREADVDADHADIYDRSSLDAGADPSRAGTGIWAAHPHAFLPDEDRYAFEEGVRRGGYLLVADVDDDEVDDAVRALNESHMGGVDIDGRASEWRAEGWTPQAPATGVARMAAGSMAAAGMQQSASQSLQSASLQGDAARTDSLQRDTTAQRIPVVEEQLSVGKREVERGGVRVYSRIVETPVDESVDLREEHVVVQRRPVDHPVSAADAAAFGEQSFEMRETAEEAVVSKSARVVEEVTINKDVEERQARINDTVRHTEVDIERLDGGTERLDGGIGRTIDDDGDYRSHFERQYGNAGAPYDDYAPAYAYGAQMGGDSRYRGRGWDAVESELRTDWASRHPANGSTWDNMKAAVRHGWERVTRVDGRYPED